MGKRCHLLGMCHHCGWVRVSKVLFLKWIRKFLWSTVAANIQMFLGAARYARAQ